MTVNVEIVKINTMNSGNLRAFVDVKVGQTESRDFRIVRQEGQAPWVSPPVSTWEDDAGERHYKRLIVFQDELKAIVDRAILDYWQNSQQ